MSFVRGGPTYYLLIYYHTHTAVWISLITDTLIGIYLIDRMYNYDLFKTIDILPCLLFQII